MLCGLLALTGLRSACAQPAVDCEQAGHAAEQQFALPPGLLLAIGKIESGHRDEQLGRVVPWPWSVDAGGQGQLFDSKAAAISAVHELQTQGHRNIDVGCFQINLLHHPNAFPDLDQAFDPQVNAQYAARFLVALHAQVGDWQRAVAAYHSATPDIGLPYGARVLAAWSGVPDSISADNAQIAGVRVWRPSPVGTAPATIVIPVLSPLPLPRVVTPLR